MIDPRPRFDALAPNVKGALVLVVAAFGFSLMVALINLVGTHIPVTQVLLIRQWVMVSMLIPAFIKDFPALLVTSRPDLQVLRITLALVAMSCGFTAVVNLPLADATALGFVKSFFVTIFAVLVLKETVGIHRWSAVALGFLGVLFMAQPGTESYSVYGLLALIGSAAAGCVMVVIRILNRTESTNTILVYQALGVGLIMIAPAWWQWVTPTAEQWALMIAIGFVSFFAQKANILAYRYGEASVLASLDYVRLLFATAFGAWLFSQWPSKETLFGAMIIILASLYTVHRENKRKQVLASAAESRPNQNH